MPQTSSERVRAGSVPDIASASAGAPKDTSTMLSFVTTHARHKRTFDDTLKDDLDTFKNEIKSMFTCFTIEQTSKLNAIENSLRDIRKINSEIEKSIEYLSQQYDLVIKKVKTLEEECKSNRLSLTVLQDKIEILERNYRSTKAEIRNFPGTSSEKKSDLLIHLQQLIKSMNTDLRCSDIIDVYRVPGKKDLNRPLIIELSNSAAKNRLINSAKNFNKSKNVKLNSTHAGLEGPAVPIYIADHLTPLAARLYYLARNLKKSEKIKHCWTADGRVLIRTGDITPVIHLKCETQLEDLNLVK